MSLTLQLADSAANTVSYMAAGLGNDGAGGSVQRLVNKVTMVVAVVAGGVFAVLALKAFATSSGTEGHKKLVHLGAQFALVMGLIIGTNGIIRIAAMISRNAFN